MVLWRGVKTYPKSKYALEQSLVWKTVRANYSVWTVLIGQLAPIRQVLSGETATIGSETQIMTIYVALKTVQLLGHSGQNVPTFALCGK
jgi:hypothetical protein